MAVNMAAGLTLERNKNHTQLSYMYVLPLLRKFQFRDIFDYRDPLPSVWNFKYSSLGGMELGGGAQIFLNCTMYCG